MSARADQLRAATNTAVEGASAAEKVGLTLYDPDPEINSVIEHILELRHDGVPIPRLRAIVAEVVAAIRHNDVSASCHLTVAGDLDRLLMAERAIAAQPALDIAITIRGLKRALADHLEVLARNDEGEHVDPAELVEARRVVRALVDTAPRERLLSPQLAHELGGRRARALASAYQKITDSSIG